jgi:fatty-acyl-CoA synthase
MELNLGDVHDALASVGGDRPALVGPHRRASWAEVGERTRRFASFLHAQGLGCHVERSELDAWESGQDHLAIVLPNRHEHLESFLGACKARVAPCNVNPRYVPEEIRYVLADSRAVAVVYPSSLAPVMASIRSSLPALRLLVQVDDGGGPLLAGAHDYEAALASGDPLGPPVVRTPDDLYVLYTGGTTGSPKGVLWRQADAITECFGGPRAAASIDEVVRAATWSTGTLLAPPLAHGTAQWMAMACWLRGGRVVIVDTTERLDAAAIWTTAARERVSYLLVVGDAFVRPLIDELDRAGGRYDLTHLTALISGGAPLSAWAKQAIVEHLPTVVLVDGLGSSETGGQLSMLSTAGGITTSFALGERDAVLADGADIVVPPVEGAVGRLARRAPVALGYLNDPERTHRTFPVVDGVRFAVPGDLVRVLVRAEGAPVRVELLGRDASVINTGGEKVHAEEIEAALLAHPDVYDCVVTARPSDRWGHDVVAIVQRREHRDVDANDLLEALAKHIARYKLPKAFVFVPEIKRSPIGKADRRWAAQVATDAVNDER